MNERRTQNTEGSIQNIANERRTQNTEGSLQNTANERRTQNAERRIQKVVGRTQKWTNHITQHVEVLLGHRMVVINKTSSVVGTVVGASVAKPASVVTRVVNPTSVLGAEVTEIVVAVATVAAGTVRSASTDTLLKGV